MDTNQELKQNIHTYLNEAKMMQLATATPDGAPWVCNVWFAADDDFSLYWISSTTRRHSRELADNSRVAASICLVRDPSESARGALQIEGDAKQITNPLEIAKALKLYVKRGIFTKKQIETFMADIAHPHRLYKLTPQTIVLFDTTRHEYIV